MNLVIFGREEVMLSTPAPKTDFDDYRKIFAISFYVLYFTSAVSLSLYSIFMKPFFPYFFLRKFRLYITDHVSNIQ